MSNAPGGVSDGRSVPGRRSVGRPSHAGAFLAPSRLRLGALVSTEVTIMRSVSLTRNPSRARPGKALLWLVCILALGMFSCCGFVGFFAMKSAKQKQEALAEGDKLYPTNPAAAISKYKEGYDAASTRKAEVLQRIVDHEAGAGNTAEATKWIDKGLDDRLTPAYTSAAAKDLLAKAQKDRADRETAKKAAEDAKRVERDAKAKQRDEEKNAKDQVKANKNLPRDQFRSLVTGKTEQQVLDALGKPDQTQDIEGTGKMWYYHNVAVDPTTGKKTAIVQLVFEGGAVGTVNFN